MCRSTHQEIIKILFLTYEKKRMGKGFLKFYNPFKNIRDSLVRPHQFLNNRLVTIIIIKKYVKQSI